MTFIGLIFIVLYLLIFTKSFVNISRGNFEYLLYYICLALPFYATLQAQVFEIFNNELLVNMIKLSKDFIFFYALLIFIVGKNESIYNRTFTFSNLDKLFLSFVILIIFYTIIPIGEADLISRIIYSKNILLIPLVYLIGRNLEFSDKVYTNLKNIFLVVIITSSVFVFFEFIFSTHFHSFINYSNYNSIVNEIDPLGNYGLSWSFESQGARPRYAAFFADPLELSASLLFFFSFIIFFFYKRVNLSNVLPFILIVFLLLMSFSRGAIVACFGIVLFSLLINQKYRILFTMFSISVILSLLTYFLGGEDLQYLIIDTLKFENTSSLGHLIEWIEGILSIIENPLGIGLAMSGNAGGVDQSLKVGGENQFLIFGVQMGIIAIIIYSVILLKVIIRSLKLYVDTKDLKHKHISFIVACTKFGLILPLLTANAELYLFVSLVSWLLAGYVEKTYLKQQLEKN
ncbi:MAG: O-antigen ligase family protein [Candidatus Marinimicrobia bacterium]|nr:O-antigen ligase family protein [Candidatus Neomarinimicrobiota bacterium]